MSDGLRGMSRLPRDTVRARRNATIFASDFVSVLGDGLTVDGGYIVVDLAADKGLEFIAGDLATKIQSPLICDAAGLGIDPGVGIAISGTELILDILNLTTDAIAAGDWVPFHDLADTPNKIAFSDFEATLDHDALTNFVGNEHIDWTNATDDFLTTGTLASHDQIITGDGTNPALRINQGADSVGFRIYGFDDRDTVYGRLRIDASGNFFFAHAGVGANHMYFDTPGDIIFRPYAQDIFFDSRGEHFIRFHLNTVYDQMGYGLHDSGGNQFIYTSYSFMYKDHGHAVQAHPTIYIHSDNDPTIDGTQWMSLAHDGTNGIIISGTGTISFDDENLITTGKINLRDTAIGIYSQADTFLDLFADGAVRIGDSSGGAPTNYAEIKSDGEINLHGTARVIRHLRVGAASWDKGASAPTGGFEGVFSTLDFDNTTDDEAHFTIIVPYRWDSTVDIEFAVDWFYDGAGAPGTVEDAGTVCWALEYKAVKAGELVTGAGTTIAKTSAGNHSSDKMVRTTFTTKILAANLEAGDTLGFRLYRDVDGGGDAGDTLAIDARLINTHFHFTMDKLGEAT